MDVAPYNILKSIVNDETVFNALSEEEKLFVVDMKLEFERGGVHLTGSARETSASTHAEVSQHETLYMQNLLGSEEAFEIISLSPEEKAQFKPWLKQVNIKSSILLRYFILLGLYFYIYGRQFLPQPTAENSLLCPSNRRVVHSLLRQMSNEKARQEIFEKSMQYPSKNRGALGALIKARYLLGIQFF